MEMRQGGQVVTHRPHTMRKPCESHAKTMRKVMATSLMKTWLDILERLCHVMCASAAAPSLNRNSFSPQGDAHISTFDRPCALIEHGKPLKGRDGEKINEKKERNEKRDERR